MKIFNFSLMILMLNFIGIAMATAAEGISCTTIEDSVTRLECYDSQNAAVLTTEDPGLDTESPLRKRIESEKKLSILGDFIIVPHRPTYIMPLTYAADINIEPFRVLYGNAVDEVDNYEAKVQLSFKVPLWLDIADKDINLWFGYTQLSLWQVYNIQGSSPFRETNYEPEIILSFDTDYKLFGMNNTFIMLGLNHQSNGQAKPLSRSWNRLYANFVFETKNLVIFLKPWYRLPEHEEDDNPDIEEYLGYGELSLYFNNDNRITGVRLWNNLLDSDNHTSVQLDWNFPIGSGFKGYIQFFNGYGETLVDYNYRTRRIGFGIMLTDWF